MRQLLICIITILTLIIIGYQIYLTMQFESHTVNDKVFMIERNNNVDAQKLSLNILVEVRKKLDYLVQYLKAKYPNDTRMQRMEDRFANTTIRESNYDPDNPGQSSYTINKGDLMVLCLRNSDNQMAELNLLTYVAIHELSHVFSSSMHHNKEFWNNMQFIEKEAIAAGVYKWENYAQNPKKYCGITIKSNLPL
jgi:hypothetical protein